MAHEDMNKARMQLMRQSKMSEAKGAPAQPPKDKQVKRKAAKQNAEIGSGPVMTNKVQLKDSKKRRKAGMPK